MSLHDHSFGQQHVRPGERRTLIVIAITAIMTVVEIAAGFVFGSMALLADGLHMASHAAALSISAIAYFYARRHAFDRRYTFGTGKANALGGFAGANLLAVFCLIMAVESAQRFFQPVPIDFDHALWVAVLGLLVNGACVVILRDNHGHDHGHGHHHSHDHTHVDAEDHNLRSAYLHVLADALTSLLAIGALLAGKYFGQGWMDPAMGVVGAVLVGRWSIQLLRDTSGILLDAQASEDIVRSVRDAIEQAEDTTLTDVHVWSIGPGIYAAALTVTARDPRSASEYQDCIPKELGVVHSNIEVHRAV
jgi:cation diffusion facilitator family transporter